MVASRTSAAGVLCVSPQNRFANLKAGTRAINALTLTLSRREREPRDSVHSPFTISFRFAPLPLCRFATQSHFTG